MNKSYILYGIGFLLLMVVFVNDEPKVKVNYTKLYSENMFLDENVQVKSTKSQNFNNQSLKGKITVVFFWLY